MAETDKLRLSCKVCRASWEIVAPQGVTQAEWVAALEVHACPDCKAPYRLIWPLAATPETKGE